MRQLARQWDFELCAIEEPIPDGKAAAAAQARIAQMGADFLLIQVSTFAAGEILLPLADIGLPIGLWGVPEVSENGAIPNNSLLRGQHVRQHPAPVPAPRRATSGSTAWATSRCSCSGCG